MKTLEDIVDSMMELNRQHSRDRLEHIHLVWEAKSYQTVYYNPGRQTGKSMLIARKAKVDDLIICFNSYSAKEMKSRTNFFNVDGRTVKTITGIDYIGVRELQYNVVWVDEPSCLTYESKNKIFMDYAGRCNQFVFLG